MDGFVLVDKPAGMSSHALVHATRRALGLPGGRRGTKAGHAGTLDPFATGLVVVLIGAATRLMRHVVGHDKRYVLEVALGATSTTDDIAGELEGSGAPLPTEPVVRQAVAELVQMTEQVPPAVSALHVDGERAYRRVRRGEQLAMPARPVTYRSIDLTRLDRGADGSIVAVELDVRCGSGTYMRSLARDLGERLGCGGHARALRRLEVGGWSVVDAPPPEQVQASVLRPGIELVDDMDVRELGTRAAIDIVHGRRVAVAPGSEPVPRDVAVTSGGQLVAICEERAGTAGPSTCVLHPRTVLVSPDALTGVVAT